MPFKQRIKTRKKGVNNKCDIRIERSKDTELC